ncbi:MAG: flagellar hook-length control protein FliK [Lautropia sp.]|nr:flagellar hook-length control protein FliK [Lautropia sp.]
MKTGTHLNSSQAVPAHSLPSRFALRARTGQGNALPQLSFQALFADIKPGAFEEMSKKALALRDEQSRIAQARRQQKPREQDQFHALTPETPRSTSLNERPPAAPVREAAPGRKLSRMAGHADAASRPEPAATASASTQKMTDQGGESTGSSVNPAPQDARQTSPVAQGHERAGTAQTRVSAGSDTSAAPKTTPAAPSTRQGDQQLTPDTPAEPGTSDLPQAVADALAYIESQNTRQRVPGSAPQQAQTVAEVPAVDTDQVPGETLLMEGQTPADMLNRASGSTAQMVQAATSRTADPSSATTNVSGLQSEGEMLQALSGTAADMDSSSGQPRQGSKDQRTPSLMAMTQSAAAKPASNATVLQAGTAMATAQTSVAQAAPAVSSEAFNLDMNAGAGRAGATPVGVALPVQTGHSPTRADGSPLLGSRIDAGIQTEAFREQFAKQVAGLMVQGQDRAEIRLTPAELGPIRIRVSLSADDAQLDISATHASTRAAIEASMSTLRQLLSEQGIRLAEYRMDNGQNPAFAQNRQAGQDLSSNLQQNGTAFGQGNGTGHPGSDSTSGRSTGRGNAAGGSGSVADSGRTGGSARGQMTTGNGRVDLFA